MRKKYSLTHGNRIATGLFLALLPTGMFALAWAISALGIWIIVTGQASLVDIAGTVGLLALAALLSYIVLGGWKEYLTDLKGVVVNNQGMSIGRRKFKWSDIEEVYTNPEDNFVTLCLYKDRVKFKSHVKKDVLQPLDGFLEDVKHYGIVVREDTLPTKEES